jgi:hypothetical protein
MGGEGTGIHHHVDHGAGDEGRELFHAVEGLEQQMGGAIARHRLELDQDASVGAEAHAILGDGRGESSTGPHRAVTVVLWCGELQTL